MIGRGGEKSQWRSCELIAKSSASILFFWPGRKLQSSPKTLKPSSLGWFVQSYFRAELIQSDGIVCSKYWAVEQLSSCCLSQGNKNGTNQPIIPAPWLHCSWNDALLKKNKNETFSVFSVTSSSAEISPFMFCNILYLFCGREWKGPLWFGPFFFLFLDSFMWSCLCNDIMEMCFQSH